MKARVIKTGEIVTILTMPNRDTFLDTNYNPYTYDELNFSVPADAQVEPSDPMGAMVNMMMRNNQLPLAVQLACQYMAAHGAGCFCADVVVDFVKSVMQGLKEL